MRDGGVQEPRNGILLRRGVERKANGADVALVLPDSRVRSAESAKGADVSEKRGQCAAGYEFDGEIYYCVESGAHAAHRDAWGLWTGTRRTHASRAKGSIPRAAAPRET